MRWSIFILRRCCVINEQNLCIFDGEIVDILPIGDNVYFSLNSVASVLGIANPRTSIDTSDADYIVRLKNSDVGKTYSRKLNNNGELFLTEAGMYKLVLRSNKPKAEKFQKWVTKEILPNIRRTGRYETPEYKLMLEAKEEIAGLKQMLLDSGVLRTNVNPRYTFDRLYVRYKIATNDDSPRGFYDAIGNYFGIAVPYSSTIKTTVKDWILAKINIDDLQAFIIGIESNMIVKSQRGYYVNLNGFGSNNVEWNKVVNEFNGRCAYCGTETALIPEHIVPQSVMSIESPEKTDLVQNIVCACGSCNGAKGKQDMTEWFEGYYSFTEQRLRKIQNHIKKYEV